MEPLIRSVLSGWSCSSRTAPRQPSRPNITIILAVLKLCLLHIIKYMMVTITTIGNPFSDEGKELILFGSNSAADVSVLKITE